MKRPIVFISDRAMLPGLHVALHSTLQRLGKSSSQYVVYIFAERWAKRDFDDIKRTFALAESDAQLLINEFTSSLPKGANSLHGNATTYGRLMLPKLLSDYDTCVYLDSDLLVLVDVGGIFDRIAADKTLAADGTGRRKHSLDKPLFSAAGLDEDGPCFNAGVLGMNLARWRTTGVDEKLAVSLAKWPGMFSSADQALLNVTLHDDFAFFGNTFNLPLPPNANTLTADEADGHICHFVGSPKPWDFGGRTLHRNFNLWLKQYQQTAIGDSSLLGYVNWGRALMTSRSLYKCWRSRRKC